jgi:hypothetical protein
MVRFPMEMQVYHCKDKSKCDHKSDYMVVSVLFGVGNSSSSQELENLFGPGAASFETGKGFDQRKLKKKGQYQKMTSTENMVDMSRLYDLSASFFHYHGSLTTPPCTETMQFLIQSGPMQVSMEQLKAVQKLIPYPGNSRPQQLLNNRRVTYYSRPSVSSTLPYRWGPKVTTKRPFHALPPAWAREEYCNNKPSSATPAASETNVFYNCDQ